MQNVLQGHELRFGHGYFVVKNPDQVSLNNRLSHRDAREQERQFFATAPPWSSILRAHEKRFGSANLQKYLSEQLAGQMMKALPIIKQQVKVRLDEIDKELASIPAPPPSHSVSCARYRVFRWCYSHCVTRFSNSRGTFLFSFTCADFNRPNVSLATSCLHFLSTFERRLRLSTLTKTGRNDGPRYKITF